MLTNKVHWGTGGNSWLTNAALGGSGSKQNQEVDLQAWTAWTMVKPVKHRAQFRVHPGGEQNPGLALLKSQDFGAWHRI